MNLRKFAQQVVTWQAVAKKEGLPLQDYLDKVKTTIDYKLLSQLARAVASFKGFGGGQLTGFQRKIIAAAATQRLKALGYLGTQDLKKSSPT
jgi:hypothetical protein